jgi:hypothetical protein
VAAKKATKKTEKLTIDKQVVTDLASCVLWALKFLKSPHGGGLWTNMRTMESKAWEEKFMEALDGVGYRIDRKTFWKKRDEKTSRPRTRAAVQARRNP